MGNLALLDRLCTARTLWRLAVRHNIAVNALIIPAAAASFNATLAGLYLVLAVIVVYVRRNDFFAMTKSPES